MCFDSGGGLCAVCLTDAPRAFGMVTGLTIWETGCIMHAGAETIHTSQHCFCFMPVPVRIGQMHFCCILAWQMGVANECSKQHICS